MRSDLGCRGVGLAQQPMRNRSHTGASIKFLRRVKFVAGLAPMGGGGWGRGWVSAMDPSKAPDGGHLVSRGDPPQAMSPRKKSCFQS